MERKLRYLIILIVLLAGSAGIAYTFWASGVNSPDDEIGDGNINVGVGREIDTIIDVNDPTTNQTLVPIGTLGVSQGTNLVEAIDLTFNVRWMEELGLNAAPGTTGVLTASLVANSITLNPLVHSLVNITFTADHDIVLEGPAVLVVVRVTLTRPTNHTQYLLLAGQTFSFTMNFALNAELEVPLTQNQMFNLAFEYLDSNVFETNNLPTVIPTAGNPTVTWSGIMSRSFRALSVEVSEALITINGETRSRTIWTYEFFPLGLETFIHPLGGVIIVDLSEITWSWGMASEHYEYNNPTVVKLLSNSGVTLRFYTTETNAFIGSIQWETAEEFVRIEAFSQLIYADLNL